MKQEYEGSLEVIQEDGLVTCVGIVFDDREGFYQIFTPLTSWQIIYVSIEDERASPDPRDALDELDVESENLAAELDDIRAELKRLRAESKDSVDQALAVCKYAKQKEAEEKSRRVYYQNIVYEICRIVDQATGKSGTDYTICGTVENPSDELQKAVRALAARRRDGDLKDMAGWEAHFGTKILDPDGWRRDNTPSDFVMTAQEFARRWSQSTTSQPAPVELEKILQRIGR